MAASASINIKFAGSLSGSPNVGSTSWRGALEKALSFADGTTADKIDLLYVAERTVASNTTDSIDLAGALTDALGNTITAAELVGIFLINQAENGTANTTNLTVGSSGASNQITGFDASLATVKPGGVYVHVNPDATGIATITAGTGDILPIVNSTGASATYQLALLLRSA